MKLTLLSEDQHVVPVVYNYDSVLMGQKSGEWKFFDTSVKPGETPEQAAIRACDEYGLVVDACKDAFTPNDRSNVQFVMCSYKDGQPRIGNSWSQWNWQHPDFYINNNKVYHHDREFLAHAPSYLGLTGARPTRSVFQ